MQCYHSAPLSRSNVSASSSSSRSSSGSSVTVVTVGDQPLSEVTTSAENLIKNPSFEDGVDGYFTSSTHAENDTLHTLSGHGNTRVISVDVSTVDPSGGSKHYRISVGGSIKGS